MKYYLGCDPGWTNLAYAIVDENGALITTGCLVPKSFTKPYTAEVISRALDKYLSEDTSNSMCGAVMERFVYYEGIHNPFSEQILMVTGQMQYMLYKEYDVVPRMVKAFDWKNRLNRYIFKKGFRNPSDRFDKVFSIAAAEFIFKCKFNTDHEADAACMAYLARLSDGD